MLDLLFDWLGDLFDMGDAADAADTAVSTAPAGAAPSVLPAVSPAAPTAVTDAAEPHFGMATTIGQTLDGEEVISSTAGTAGGEAVVASTWKPAEEVSARTGTP
jgi:hypothetical protein